MKLFNLFGKENSAEEEKTILVALEQVDPNDQSSDISPEIVQSFTWTERMAHYVAYEALTRENSHEITIQDEDGIARQYRTKKLQSPDKGLVCEIITPVTPSIEQTNNLYISFTGTHSRETFLVDLQRAPGEDCFRSVELELFLYHVNQTLGELSQQSKQKIDIILIGHSLGGCYSQLGMHTLQRAIVTNLHEQMPNEDWLEIDLQFRLDLKSQFSHTKETYPKDIRTYISPDYIQSLTMGIWNSAGVLHPIERYSNILAKWVHQSGIKQRAFFGLVDGDLIQGVGEGTVLSHVSRPYAELHLVNINRREEWFNRRASQSLSSAATSMNLGAPGMVAVVYMDIKEKADYHTTPNFNAMAEDLEIGQIKFQYIQNDTEQGRDALHHKLVHSKRFISTIVRSLRKVAYSICNFIFHYKQIEH